MKDVYNERGYALIIVLLIITIIGIFIPVLMTSVFSSSNQFKIVEAQLQQDKLLDMGRLHIDRTFEKVALEYKEYIEDEDVLVTDTNDERERFFSDQINMKLTNYTFNYKDQDHYQSFTINIISENSGIFHFSISTTLDEKSDQILVKDYQVNLNDFIKSLP